MADGTDSNKADSTDDFIAIMRRFLEAFSTQIVTPGDFSVFLIAAPIGFIAPVVVALPAALTAGTCAMLFASFAVGTKKGVQRILRARARRRKEDQREQERARNEQADNEKQERTVQEAKLQEEKDRERAAGEDPKIKIAFTGRKLIEVLTEYQLHEEAKSLTRDLKLYEIDAIPMEVLSATIRGAVESIRNKDPLPTT